MVGESLRDRKAARTRAAIAAAALELFSRRGFDDVTVAEVADAADVGHRTLFRYYADKEDLLFGDDLAVEVRLAAELAGRPEGEPAATGLLEAVVSLAPWWQEHREQGRARQAVIDASPALQARQRAKHRSYETVITDGLVARGAGEVAARLLSRVAVACTDHAVTQWFTDDDPGQPGLEHRIRATFGDAADMLAPVRSEAPRGAPARP